MVSEVENAIEHFTITEATMIKDYSGDFRSENQFFVTSTVDVLQKDVFQSFLAKIKGADKFIAAAKRHLEIHRHTRHYSIKSLLVHRCKVHPMGMQEFMAGMLGVMLIVGIVDNALQVAFIVADLEVESKQCRFYHTGWDVWLDVAVGWLRLPLSRLGIAQASLALLSLLRRLASPSSYAF